MVTADSDTHQANAQRRTPSAILVVEDEPEIREPLCHSLRRAGYIVFEAEDGLSACRIIGSQLPDLILLDIMLPDLDGWEICRLLRQHPDEKVASTPVIMLTALNSPEDKLHGLQLGADAYLPKPYSQQEVLLLSGKLIERHRHRLDLEEKVARLSSRIEQQQDLHSLLFHELRNQLTVLSGYAQILQGEGADASDRKVTVIHRSTSYLQHLAEDFLLIREVQGKTLQLPAEPLLPLDVARELLDLYTPLAQDHGIEVQLRVEGVQQPVVTNRPALKIILSALLDNAIKYGPENRPVLLVCRFSTSRLELEVHDAGNGIPSDKRVHVFERFYRGDRSAQVSGAGLGLFGARILAEALGGGAEVDDPLVHGSCTRVWVPLKGTVKT